MRRFPSLLVLDLPRHRRRRRRRAPLLPARARRARGGRGDPGDPALAAAAARPDHDQAHVAARRAIVDGPWRSFRPGRSPCSSRTSRARRACCAEPATATRPARPSTGVAAARRSRAGGGQVDTEGDAFFVAFAPAGRARRGGRRPACARGARLAGRARDAGAHGRAHRRATGRRGPATSGSTSTTPRA